MQEYLGPNVTITYGAFNGDSFPGHILLDKPESLPKLPSAILDLIITRLINRGASSSGTEKHFGRAIRDSNDGTAFGVLYVNRPTPDPDTRFASLTNEPLLAAIPTGLRPAVDPASLIPLPTPTGGCVGGGRCVVIFPVSTNTVLHSLVKGSDIALVRRRFLLWP